jgi:hypothetical protein
MNKIIKNRIGFLNITAKLANMKKSADFTIYPYSGGDTISIQSDKRFCEINIRTGEGKINKKGVNYANNWVMTLDPLFFAVESEIIIELKKYFWENEGANGGGSLISWENKPLYSI